MCRPVVLCFDGTGNEFSPANTNVMKLYSALERENDNDDNQMSYYQAGIGTPFAPRMEKVRRRYRKIEQLIDKAIATSLCDQVRSGYEYLMECYKDGDKICIFGFSRGAYTARVLAGLLHKVGLLRRKLERQFQYAYKFYRCTDPGDADFQGFRRTFCRDVHIDFVGVWDTVTSVGLFRTRSLPFVEEENPGIRILRHAVALDEHRTKFRPNLCVPPHQPGMDRSGQPKMKEVWFAGCHGDVGGGATKNTEQHSLSNIPLRWMMNEAMRTECPILFTEEAKRKWQIFGNNNPPKSDLRSGGDPGHGQHVDQYDEHHATQNIRDTLKKPPWLWWFLEFVPVPHAHRNARGERVTNWWPQFGRGRKVPQGALFHKSVKTRMNNLNYIPRANCGEVAIEYVS